MPTPKQRDDLRTRIVEAIMEVRDRHPRHPQDADSEEVADAVLAQLSQAAPKAGPDVGQRYRLIADRDSGNDPQNWDRVEDGDRVTVKHEDGEFWPTCIERPVPDTADCSSCDGAGEIPFGPGGRWGTTRCRICRPSEPLVPTAEASLPARPGPGRRYRTVADRYRGDDPQERDSRGGDRLTFIAADNFGKLLVRIDRPERVPVADEVLAAGEFQDAAPGAPRLRDVP